MSDFGKCVPYGFTGWENTKLEKTPIMETIKKLSDNVKNQDIQPEKVNTAKRWKLNFSKVQSFLLDKKMLRLKQKLRMKELLLILMRRIPPNHLHCLKIEKLN